MTALELKVYDILKARFNEEEALTVIEYIETKTKGKVQQKEDIFLTKDDKVDIVGALYRTVYTSSIIQFLTMVAVFYFMLKK